jgi:mono/diheme cytochrome c family protein
MKRILNKSIRIDDMRFVKSLFVSCAAGLLLTACGAGGDNQGLEYAPNMYHSVAYEPYTQILDKDAGAWVTSIDYPDGHGEFFNSNQLNISRMNSPMNMRTPPANTVSRNKFGWLPYRYGKDSLALGALVKNPLDSSAAVIADGKMLYEIYCDHCHGAKGAGDGKVAQGEVKINVDGEEKQRSNYNGVANLTADQFKGISEGHIFHVITHGKGLMWPHGSQISPEDRWKIAKYVKTLQKK